MISNIKNIVFPEWSESDLETVDENFLENLEMPDEDDARTIYETDSDEFDINLDNFEPVVEKGKEIKLIEKSDTGGDGPVYAGGWPQTLFEGAKEKSRQPIWIGHAQSDALQGPVEVPVKFEDLFRHVAMFGSTGMGKSTVLKNTMVQIANGGHGFCYIDPKGDDSLDLLQQLPDDRLDDVIWVEPSPEDFDEVIGINFLDTTKEYGEDGFQKEATSIIDDVIPILRDEGYWGERMDEVVRGFLRGMLYLDENYTIVDLYKLLADKEIRASFSEKIEREIPQEDILVKQIQKISEIDTEDLSAARRRITDWVMTEQIQQVVAHTESSVNITKAVENGKIIIVRTASIRDEKAKKGVATVIIRRIWTAIQMREQLLEENREPYFLLIDEFDNVVNKESDIGHILSNARSLKLGVFLSNQQPHQLDREVQQDVLGNCNTLLALNPRNSDDARVISGIFDCNTSEIQNLPEYTIGTKFTVDGEMKEIFPTKTFPEYPPKRSREKAQEIRENIVKDLGVEPDSRKTEEDIEDTKFEAKKENTNENSKFQVGDDGTKLELREILKSIYITQIRNGGPNHFVTVDEIEKTIEQRHDSASYNRITNILTEKLEFYIEKRLGDQPELRLTKTGQQKAFTEDTGDSSTAGKAMHRMLLQLSAELFVRLGYDYNAPKQVGEEQPDAIAKPPIRPGEANSAREMQNRIRELEEKHPRIVEVFGYEDLAVEAEKATMDSKPYQVLKNLRKALDGNTDCVFVVQDGKYDGESFSSKVQSALRYLKNPKFARGYRERENSNKKDIWYYNGNNIKISGQSQTYAVKPDTKSSVWKKDVDTGEIILENPNGDEPYAVFDKAEDVKNPTAKDFPFTYKYDNKQQAIIVTNKEGDEVAKFESTENKKPKKIMKENGYSPIKKPFIPENEFTGEELPGEESWHIVVVPHSDRDYGPRYYDKENDELRPVFEDDQPLSIDKIPGPEEELNEPEKEANTPNKQESEQENKNKKRDSQTTRSTTDVVEESDEVWTKPGKGDDDYNPAKDNQNFTVGFDEERTDENWTGGQAREEDKNKEMKDYELTLEDENDGDEDDEDSDKNKNHEDELVDGDIEPIFEDETANTDEKTDNTKEENDETKDKNNVKKTKVSDDKTDENFGLFEDLIEDEESENKKD